MVGCMRRSRTRAGSSRNRWTIRRLPDYTGKYTVWGGFNANRSTLNGTSTFSVRGTGSDGATFASQSVDHFNVRPDGTVKEFFHCN